jgi:hypothetical protein
MNNKGREMVIGITIVVVIALMWIARFIPFGELSGMAVPDENLYYVTPALYFFSSIAQTMGAILGLALAAMYAIMPNIRSSKDNPAFEPARRLLQRDKVFHKSINTGFVSILLSALGLFTIYTFGASQLIAIICWVLFGVTSLGLAIWAIVLMLDFIRNRMAKYFSPLEMLTEFAFKNNLPVSLSKNDAIDYAEISILLESFGLKNEFSENALLFILNSSEFNSDNSKHFFDTLFSNIEKDILRSSIVDDNKMRIYSKIMYSIWDTSKRIINNGQKDTIDTKQLRMNIIKLILKFNSVDNNYLNDLLLKILEDINYDFTINELIIYDPPYIFKHPKRTLLWIWFIFKLIKDNKYILNITRHRIPLNVQNMLFVLVSNTDEIKKLLLKQYSTILRKIEYIISTVAINNLERLFNNDTNSIPRKELFTNLKQIELLVSYMNNKNIINSYECYYNPHSYDELSHYLMYEITFHLIFNLEPTKFMHTFTANKWIYEARFDIAYEYYNLTNSFNISWDKYLDNIIVPYMKKYNYYNDENLQLLKTKISKYK